MTNKKDQKQATILNIGVDSTTMVRVITFVQDSLKRGSRFYIVTPNPEIALEASKDLELTRIINGASISIPDGIGLAIAQEFLSYNKIVKPFNYFVYPIQWLVASINKGKKTENPLTILKGRELFVELLKLANKKKWKIFLFGGINGSAQKTKVNIEKTLKSVEIETGEPGTYSKNGEPVSESDINIENDIINHINVFKPQLLFVALNTPKQEKFIDRMLPNLSIGGAMTVGGSFNYLAGYSKLPPKWLSNSGFEWLWRLASEPWRIGRIFNALIVFPIKVIAQKINDSK